MHWEAFTDCPIETLQLAQFLHISCLSFVTFEYVLTDITPLRQNNNDYDDTEYHQHVYLSVLQ